MFFHPLKKQRRQPITKAAKIRPSAVWEAMTGNTSSTDAPGGTWGVLREKSQQLGHNVSGISSTIQESEAVSGMRTLSLPHSLCFSPADVLVTFCIHHDLSLMGTTAGAAAPLHLAGCSSTSRWQLKPLWEDTSGAPGK